jgi:hypothetical protein
MSTRNEETETRLSEERAFALASRLTLIPEFPNPREAVLAAAEWLVDVCKTEHRAKRLVNDATRNRDQGARWGGLPELQDRFDAMFPPVKLGTCQDCYDYGVVNHAIHRGVLPARWCRCPAGVARRRREPNLLVEINARQTGKALDELRIVHADLLTQINERKSAEIKARQSGGES